MTNILYISASIQGDQSISRGLGNKLLERLSTGTDSIVTTRDLSHNDLPFIDADRFAANLAPMAERTPEQAQLASVADTLIKELQAADTIVFAVPIYNFGVPASVKAWADLVARAGTTFKYTESGPVGLLEGKNAYITVASGGTPVGSDFDLMTPWFKVFLGFIGISDVQIIAADGIMGRDGEEKIAAAHAKIETIGA